VSSYACVSSSSLLVDLSDADWVSIAGLLGLHAVALIAQGAQPPDRQAG